MVTLRELQKFSMTVRYSLVEWMRKMSLAKTAGASDY